MKRFVFMVSMLLTALAATPFAVHAGDIALLEDNVRFSTTTFLEGRTIRIYGSSGNASQEDERGVVRFFDNGNQIQGDQPVSVLAGKEDSVFVDWVAVPGEHTIMLQLIPFDNPQDDPSNNTVKKTIVVLADTDRDGTPNKDDTDDDNDGTPDETDAFPLNKNEQLDTDGDAKGNNADDDDDNDGVKDAEDALPLDTNEREDTDKDGIGNNKDDDDDGDGLPDKDEVTRGTDPLKTDSDGDTVDDRNDAFPNDPTQARDYDRDGISDGKDPDADNDGIAKEKDTNDTNLGPSISVTTDGKAPRRFVYPEEPVSFETTTTLDPDGKVSETEWGVLGQKIRKEKLEVTFPKPGIYTVKATVKDDKGELREKAFKVYAVPRATPWILITLILLILILAFFFLFSYSKRRRSRFSKVTDTLDTVLGFLPKPKPKGKKR